MGESRQMASMSSDNCPLLPPRIGYDVGQRPHTSFQVCPDAEILRRSHVRQVGEKHRKEGFLHVFWRLWEQEFDAFCPFSEVWHSGSSRLLMSYLIDLLLFRWINASLPVTVTVVTVFFLLPSLALILYITIYISVTYILLARLREPQKLIVTIVTVTHRPVYFTSLQGHWAPGAARCTLRCHSFRYVFSGVKRVKEFSRMCWAGSFWFTCP